MEQVCFVFVYENLVVGGIQNYIYHAVNNMLLQGHTVILSYGYKKGFDAFYSDVFHDDKIIRCDFNHYSTEVEQFFKKHEKGKLIIHTYTVPDFAVAERIKAQYKERNIHTFYSVPNFKGPYYYLEESFYGFKKRQIKKRMTSIIQKMHQNGNIHYFNKAHILEMTRRYSYVEPKPEIVLLPPMEPIPSFDSDRAKKVFQREEFRIISVSRFDFPHKGYLIGLIKAFGRIKARYPRCTLMVVGYGAGLNEIRETIASLPKDAQSSITLTGKQAPEELVPLYKEANLNISAAACCTKGARQGVISIPVRHFSYSGEVYGFLPEAFDKLLSDQPGEAPDKYIELVLSMTQEEYVTRCRMSYETVLKSHNERSLKLDSDENNTKETLSPDEIEFILGNVSRIAKNIRFNSYFERIKHDGLANTIFRKIKKS